MSFFLWVPGGLVKGCCQHPVASGVGAAGHTRRVLPPGKNDSLGRVVLGAARSRAILGARNLSAGSEAGHRVQSRRGLWGSSPLSCHHLAQWPEEGRVSSLVGSVMGPSLRGPAARPQPSVALGQVRLRLRVAVLWQGGSFVTVGKGASSPRGAGQGPGQQMGCPLASSPPWARRRPAWPH